MRVCILGSGLTALTLAKALVNQNIYVDLVLSKKNFKNNQSRTIGISKTNCEYFNKNIINIDNIIWKLKNIEIYNDKLANGKILNFENNKNVLFSIIKNNQIYKLLNKSLTHNKFIKKIKINEKNINLDQYNLIVNTDYNSIFTRRYFSKKIVKNYNSSAYTTFINHEKIENNVAIQIFTKIGPLAFLPISKNKTSVVYSTYNQKNNNDKIISLIKKYNHKYKIKKIEKLEKSDLKSFILRSYYHEKILAFGDLLHRVHPLAGQGFNMTIRDVEILMNIIKSKVNLGIPIDASINKEFEKKLRHKNYLFSNGIDLIYEFFKFERKFDSNILSKSLKLIGKNNSLNKLFISIADKGINF